MKFIHLADSHIDGFKDQRLSNLGFESFRYVIDVALDQEVDFVLIAGDLFNTAIPRVDALKQTAYQLKKLKDANIPVYAIPGSHDFSPHGKTMLDVFEISGLLINVMQGDISDNKLSLEFTIDKKTNTQLTGIMGKKGMLDKKYYQDLKIPEIDKNNFSIFMFHTSISELRPKKLERMESFPVSFLPEGFDYYAGGHVHIRKRYSSAMHRDVVYPGPTFPNNFSELEELKHGSFIIYDSEETFSDNEDKHYTHVTIPTKPVLSITIDAENKSPKEVFEISQKELLSKEKELHTAIVLLRFKGTLSEGKPSEIDFKELIQICYDKGSFIVLKNTYKLQGKLFEEIDSNFQSESEDIEKETIKEHVGQIKLPEGINEEEAINKILDKANIEPLDGEKKTIFTQRVVDIIKEILEKE